jgi:hypothetical protein
MRKKPYKLIYRCKYPRIKKKKKSSLSSWVYPRQMRTFLALEKLLN